MKGLPEECKGCNQIKIDDNGEQMCNDKEAKKDCWATEKVNLFDDEDDFEKRESNPSSEEE